MAENNNDPNNQGERDGKIHATEKEEQGAVSINSESFLDQISGGLLGVNTKLTLSSFAMGNVTAGNNQQFGKENLDEELAPRTNANTTNNKNTSGDSTAPIEQVQAPKEGVDGVLEEPENSAENMAVKIDDNSSSGDDKPAPKVENPADEAATTKTTAELAKNAASQEGLAHPGSSAPEKKDPTEAANSSIVLQIMGEYKKNIEDVKAKEVNADQASLGESETDQAIAKINSENTGGADLGGGTTPTTGGGGGADLGGGENTNEVTTGGGGADLSGETTNKPVTGGGGSDLGGETTNENTGGGGSDLGGGETANRDATQSGETTSANQNELSDPEDKQTEEQKRAETLFNDSESTTQEAAIDAEVKKREAARSANIQDGLNVGRSVGYGAIIEDGGNKITPFGADEASSQQALALFRDGKTEEAKGKGDAYYNDYAKGYNEGMEEGIKLKREADEAARNQTLKNEQSTIEYQVGMILGTACGAASAKGETEIDASYEIPKENADPEKVTIKGPMAPVRNAIMSDKKTPDGKLTGDALERAFMQHYNMAQQEGSKRKPKGPEKDADYQAGYERGYKLGGQRAEGQEGDEDLVADKLAYNKLSADAPKPQLQKKNGFYDGYNKGQIDVENSKAAAKKEATKARNENPIFMSGFATGNMQGFLKALLDPSGTDLLTALNNPQVMKDGGIPEFFPIPDAIRKNVQAVLGQGGDPAITTLLAKPLFQEGLLMGYNAGYGRGEQNRMTFKRQQFKLHPDYQESLKKVYEDKNMGQLKAKIQVDYRELQKKEEITEEEKTQLDTYAKTLAALDGEINKQSDFYQRGVIDCYNGALPEEEKRVKNEKIAEAHNDPQYKAGFKWGQAVGNQVFDKKEKIKKWRRNGIDVSSYNSALNQKLQDTRKKSQKEGKKYFDGYARGYSDTLRDLEKKSKQSDMGNKIEDLTNITRNVDDSFLREHKKEAETAFKDGATQGYNLYFQNKKINVETGQPPSPKDLATLHDKHVSDKEKGYKANDKLKEHADKMILFFKAGYSYIEDQDLGAEGKQYGAPKGLWDAQQFNKGYNKAIEDAKTGETTEGTTDAFKVGYNAGKKGARYNNFRNNMIHAQEAIHEDQVNNPSAAALPATANRDHTQHAATENSIADTSALGALEETKEKEQEVAQAKLAEQGDFVYVVNAGEHELQAETDTENKKWLTKAIYLKEGISLKGTDLADATVSIQVLNGKGEAETKTMSNKPGDVQVARDFYGNKDKYIEHLADAYTKNLIGSEEALRKEMEMAEKFKDNMLLSFLKTAYDEKINSIKQAYITGYNALFNSIQQEAGPELIKAWNHDMAYIEGVRSQAGDNEEVQKLELPTSPTPNLEVNKESEEYKAGHLEGILMGQRIKSGLVDLTEDKATLANTQGGDYQRGYEEGKALGIKTGEVAAREMDKKPPNEQDIKNNLAEQREEANLTVDPEFERGYLEGFFVDYWKVRDYTYGRHVGYKRAQEGNIDGPIEAEDGITIKDQEAFFKGFNKGRENSRLGKEEGATGKEGEEKDTFKVKLKNIVLRVAWRNAALAAAEELNILSRLGLVFDTTNRLYNQFADTKSMKALEGGAIVGAETADTTEAEEVVATDYVAPPAYLVNTLEEIVKISAVSEIYSAAKTGSKATWAELTPEEQLQYAAIFKESYEHHYEATYQEALIDMANLSMVVAMDPSGTGGAGTGVGTSDDAGAIEELMKQLEALFANGNHQNFIIDELDLIDRFYDLERRIEDRHEPIKEKLEDIEEYRLAMEFYEDADTTLASAEIQQLEADIQALKDKLKGATVAEKKEINKEKRELERSLKEKKIAQRKQSGEQDGTQKEWEQVEEDVRKEIDDIREYMEDNLGFETPLESNDDILEYIKINLETSEQHKKGEKVYQDPNIFNNLVLNGTFNYQESAEFDAYVQGDGRLTIDAYAEKMKVEGIETRIEREGFKFTAKGLEHDHATNSFTLFEGNLVTPKIEGGRHAGVKLDYNFHTFRLEKGQTIKSQIETQLDKLQGG